MSNLPQIIMRHPDITKLPPLVIPKGYKLYHHEENCGMGADWENIINSSFNRFYPFDFLVNAGDYKPEYVLYLSYNGKPIATTSAVENKDYPGEGWYRMVGVCPEARGMGAGKMIALAALYALRERGYKTVVLSTDDERIPAICLYLSLGFEPVYSHESHKERWEKIFQTISVERSRKKFQNAQ